MKYKTISYGLSDGVIIHRLNDKKIYMIYNGLSHIKSKIKTRIDLIISNDGSINNSLDINVLKQDADTYKIIYPDGSEEMLDILFYYLNSNNERIYVAKSDVIIDIDGTKKYDGHVVKTYYKSDSELSLYGDYNDFINSDNYNFKNEDINNLEQEIFNINATIEDLNYQKEEYSKLTDTIYTNYEAAQKAYERISRELSLIQVNMNDALKSDYNEYYINKNLYYNNTKKTISSGYGLDGNRDVSSNVNKYFSLNSNGREMEKANLEGFYHDTYEVRVPHEYTEGCSIYNTTSYEALTDSYKRAKYYEQQFTYQLEQINQQIQYYSNLIEQSSWNYQQTINNKTKELHNASVDLNNKKTIYETKYNNLVKDYYELCIERFEIQLDYYNKLLIQKQEQLSIYKKEVPTIYLVNKDKSLIYGFNEFNKLCAIFDNYKHQLLINYDENKIKTLVDENNYKLEFIYNEDDKLIKLINDLGKSLSISYINNKISEIKDNDNNITKFEYKNGIFNKIIGNDNLGYKLHYTNNLLDKISKVSTKNNIKELHEYLYLDNEITIIDKSKYIFLNDECTYSKYTYIFDNDSSLVTEINEKNNEIEAITGYEYDYSHCNFTFESNKNDKKVFEGGEESFSGIKSYNVTLPNILKTDYTLYAISSASSLASINEYRKTAYCEHQFNISNIKYELRIVLSYSNEDITYGVSFNPNIAGKQIIAIPVTLKEDSSGKAIAPNSTTIYVDYSDNSGLCTIHNIVLSECKYNYTVFNSAKQPLESYLSDVVYPLFNDSIKSGYVIKSIHSLYSYNVNELLEKEETITNYEEYDLNNELIDSLEDNFVKNYMYDNNSKITKISDSKLNVVFNEYDENGNVIKNISYNEKNSSNVIIKDYEYDNDGNLISDSNEQGYKTKYKGTINESYEESPEGFITTISDSYIKSDLISNSKYVKNKMLDSYSNGNLNYKFEYDEWSNESSLLINDNLYMDFIYDEYLGNKYYVSKLNNNKGYMKVTDLYDKPLYIKKINNELQEIISKYEYDSNDNLISIKDKNDNILESYEYIDDVLSKISNDNYIKKYSNDIYGNVISISYDNDTYNYQYNEDNELIGLSRNSFNEELKHDSLKRIINKNNNFVDESYEYLNTNNRTTNLIKLIKQKINNRIIYNKFYYDKCGNIIKSIINHNETRYYYDGLNRLIRLDSNELNHTYTYTYDEKNNIISKGIHDLSDNNILLNSSYIDYEYDNDNRLISYDNNQIIYDQQLRPINYKENSLLWDNNKLIQYGNNYFEYDYNGLRIKKRTASEEIEYVRDGNRLLKEIHTIFNSSIIEGDFINSNIEAISSQGDVITYNYGINGIEGFTLNNVNYHYIKNIFNDVVEIIDDNYNTYAKYSYDAYGKFNIIMNVNNIANINPIRYRSYYYDKETGLYYLNSRYYDPDTMRFISIDDISYLEYDVLGGLNLWTYCNNNPIMYVDPDGNLPQWLGWLLTGVALVALTALTIISFGSAAIITGTAATMIIGATIGAYVGVGASIISQGISRGFSCIDSWQVLLDGTIGAISGAVGASGISKIGSIIIGGVLGGAGSIGSDLLSNNFDLASINIGKAIIMTAVGFCLGAFTGAGANNIKEINSAIFSGKTLASQAFKESIKAVEKQTNNTIAKQIMYLNMFKAISSYQTNAMLKVLATIFGSTFFGGLV